MPGFAITSSSTNEGTAVNAYVRNVGSAPSLIFGAAKKTRITGLLAVNVEGGILPITLFVKKADLSETAVATNSRVFKQKYIILSLVSGDLRTTEELMDDHPIAELVLLPGESLYAQSPLDNSFDVSLIAYEGIS